MGRREPGIRPPRRHRRGALCADRRPRDGARTPLRAGGIASAAAASALTLAGRPAEALGLAGGATGGGGGGGGGGGFSSSDGGGEGGGTGIWWLDLLIITGFIILSLAIGLVGGWFAGRKFRRRNRAATAAAHSAHPGDGYWHPHELKLRIEEVFHAVQASWAAGDVEGSRPYVSDALFERHRLQLEGLRAQHRVNRIEALLLHDTELVRIHNVTDDDEDRFVARIKCSARDWMEDTRTGEVVNGNREERSQFTQFWSFSRDPRHGWVLDEIQQEAEGRYHLDLDDVNADEGPPRAPVPDGGRG